MNPELPPTRIDPVVEQKEGVSNRKKAEMWVRHLEQKKEDVLRSLDVLKFIPDDLRAPEAQRLFFMLMLEGHRLQEGDILQATRVVEIIKKSWQ